MRGKSTLLSLKKSQGFDLALNRRNYITEYYQITSICKNSQDTVLLEMSNTVLIIAEIGYF